MKHLKYQKQQGVVLYVALMVMVAMMLAGVALLRAVGSGQNVAGNVAFKQNATAAGERGVTAALTFLSPASAASRPSEAMLAGDIPANGYVAAWDPTFDPHTYDWLGNTSAAGPVIKVTDDDGAGNAIRYVIHRLCESSGPVGTGTGCVAGPTRQGVGGGKGSAKTPPSPPPYYRITTRVDGPRNTVSYTQVLSLQ